MEEKLPKDETIKRWVSKKGRKKFEEEINSINNFKKEYI